MEEVRCVDTCAVVVPLYNEAAVVRDVVLGLRAHFESVICVDDGSADASGDLAAAAGATVLRHGVNLGQGAALQTGFSYVLSRTSADHVVTFDGDGQHRVEDALAMLDHARTSGTDVVLGSRNLGATAGQPLSRRLLLRAALSYSRRATGLALTDTHNGLRVLSRHAIEVIQLAQRGMAYATELEAQISRHELSWGEFPVTISYSEYSRRKGQSNLNALNIMVDLLASRMSAAS